jgi:hypothetical protein
MYCPTCGSEERQLSQYCRACGTDLRVVRRGLEHPDTITASAVSAREQISQAMAEKIRQMESSQDLKRVAEDVLPQIEKFLESPEEKRLRRVRAGVITAAAGLGAALLVFLAVASHQAFDLVPFIALGLIAFLVGLGMVINGLVFTVPRKTLADRSADAESQRQLEAQDTYGVNKLSDGSHSTNDLANRGDEIAPRSSVTEHTTHQLKPNNL